MRALSSDRIGLVISLVGGAFLLVLAGLAMAEFRLPPALAFAKVVDAAGDLLEKGPAYLGIEPVEHLEPLREVYRDPVTADPERTAPGVTLLVGLFGDELGAQLVDRGDDVVHRWPVDFFSLIEDQRKYPYDGLIHGSFLYPNGELIVNMDGDGLVKVDACGEVLWENRDRTHHAVFVDDEGFIWAPTYTDRYDVPELAAVPFRFDQVSRFDPNSGQRVLTIDLVDMLVEGGLEGVVLANKPHYNDLVHLNDVEVLSGDLAGAFPGFDAGDIMLSFRRPNQIWVLDGRSHRLKWWRTGPMHSAHDPDFQPDGTITVLDNRPGGAAGSDNDFLGRMGGSRILRLDPASHGYETVFESEGETRFYTPYRGKHQLLDNGNILIAETDAGRAIEVAPGGDVVWSWLNLYDEEQVGWLMGATRYPERYRSIGEVDCPGQA